MTLPGLNKVYDKKINLADGGLGSTLEGVLDLKIANTPLWSTRAVANQETSQLLLQAHLAFLRAGARTLLTSTYQAAFNTFEREGYSRDQALRIMSDAISIAARARALFCASSETDDVNRVVRPDEIRIVLSLGTFGSTVSPMQDFDGFFPPPFGPRAYSAPGTTDAHDDNTTSFGDDAEGIERSIQALADFHAERLSAYLRMMPREDGDEEKDAWDLVDAVAFETVPVAREITAIRRAVTRVVGEEEGKRMKPWWVTAVFPHGECSETRVPGGERLSAAEVAELMVRPGVDERGRALVVPSGIGFNCVAVEYLKGLLGEFEGACGRVMGEKEWPWLVIKPNGPGGVEEVVQCVDKARGQRWGGLIVGGCCKAGPDEIAQLRGYLS